MERFMLRRSEKRPLAFVGEKLFSETASFDSLYSDTKRREQVEVYRTINCKFVLYIIGSKSEPDEDGRGYHKVEIFNTIEDLVGYLEKEKPYWADRVGFAFGVAEEL